MKDNKYTKTFKCAAVNNKTNGRQAFYCSTEDKAIREAKNYIKCNQFKEQYTITKPVQVFQQSTYSNEIY